MLVLELFTLCRFNIEQQNSILPLEPPFQLLLPLGKKIYPQEVTSLVLVISKFYEIYLFIFLTMKEQMINLLCPVGKCGPACYPPKVIQIPRGRTRTRTFSQSYHTRPPASCDMAGFYRHQAVSLFLTKRITNSVKLCVWLCQAITIVKPCYL